MNVVIRGSHEPSLCFSTTTPPRPCGSHSQGDMLSTYHLPVRDWQGCWLTSRACTIVQAPLHHPSRGHTEAGIMSHLSYLGPHLGPCNSLAQRPTFHPEEGETRRISVLAALPRSPPFHTQIPGSTELQEQTAGRKEPEAAGRRAFVRRRGPRCIRCPVIPTGG